MLIALSILLTALASGADQPVADWEENLNQRVQKAIQENKFVDGAFAVISKDYSTIKTFGCAKSDTIFEIGSVTKTFTGIIFAGLVLENKLSADDLVQKFIPELKGTFAGSISLSQLALHTSLLPRVPEDLTNSQNPYAEYSLKDLVRYLKTVQPVAKPIYSNTGFALLGAVEAIAASQSYEELLSTRITKPLRMKDTATFVTVQSSLRFIVGHDETLRSVPHWDFDVIAPAGAIRSTTDDLLLFAQANLLPDGSPLGEAIRLSQKEGWGWDSKSINLPFPYKNGGTAGFSSALLIYPASKIAILGVTNTHFEVDTIVTSVFTDLIVSSRK